MHSDRFWHKGLNSCVKNCATYRMLGVLNQCMEQCPEGWSHLYDVRKDKDYRNCYKCKGKCDLVCPGSIITKKQHMWRYKPCTVVDGDLYIQLDGNNYESNNYLYSSLENIRIIFGALRIRQYLHFYKCDRIHFVFNCIIFLNLRSSAFLTLDYFRSLSLIQYEPDPDEKNPKEETKYALEITHNTNLHELFRFENASRPNITIVGGGILIDSNEKLCPQMIYKSMENVTYNSTHMYIGQETNGESAICVFKEFETSVERHSSSVVSILWPPFEVDVGDELLGYTVFFLKTDKNVTINTGFDSCAP